MVRKNKPPQAKKKPKTRSQSKKPGPASTEFWRSPTVEELAAEQGVKPVTDVSKLKGDFWPEDESMDEFLVWLRKLRRGEGGRP